MNPPPRSVVTVLGFVSILAIALLGTVTSAQLALSVLFLLPIFFINRFAGRWVGIGACVASAVTWLLADLSKLPHAYAMSIITYVNAFARLGVFLIVATLVQRLKAHAESLEHTVEQRTASLKAEMVERARAEAELRDMHRVAAQRERLADIGAITAQLAHDLGNPLAGVSMQAQLILRRAMRDESEPISTIRQPVERILAEVHRLDSLLKEFMEFSREQRLDVRSLDVRRFLQNVVDLWRPVAAGCAIDLILDMPHTVPAIPADADKLRRVFDNLIKNALDAIEHGPGQVHVQVTVPMADAVNITVADTGPGIKEGVQVFRLFETTKPHGSGLGLAVAQQIVLAHLGTIDYAPVVPHGTVFRITLPRRGLLS